MINAEGIDRDHPVPVAPETALWRKERGGRRNTNCSIGCLEQRPIVVRNGVVNNRGCSHITVRASGGSKETEIHLGWVQATSNKVMQAIYDDVQVTLIVKRHAIRPLNVIVVLGNDPLIGQRERLVRVPGGDRMFLQESVEEVSLVIHDHSVRLAYLHSVIGDGLENLSGSGSSCKVRISQHTGRNGVQVVAGQRRVVNVALEVLIVVQRGATGRFSYIWVEVRSYCDSIDVDGEVQAASVDGKGYGVDSSPHGIVFAEFPGSVEATGKYNDSRVSATVVCDVSESAKSIVHNDLVQVVGVPGHNLCKEEDGKD